ncbi:uncharacterized protein [Anabrus simplex]|uniref:uncharacterized protein isoform X1 n=2 Tax=Anabrus simplex TaxID=316456 RepID=UPI0035A2E806
MEKMLGILGLLLVLTVFIHTSAGDAINCVVCSGDEEPRCNVPFNMEPEPSTACYKNVCSAKLFKKGGKTVAVRGCGLPGELPVPPGSEPVKNAEFSCDNDDCNEKDSFLRVRAQGSNEMGAGMPDNTPGGGGGGGGGADNSTKPSMASLTNKPFILLCYLSPVFIKSFN